MRSLPAADRDFDEIIDTLRDEDPRSAVRFVKAARRSFSQIARHPGSGSPRFAAELELPGLRHVRVGRFPWFIFYFEGPPLTVVRILHGKRSLGPLLVGAK